MKTFLVVARVAFVVAIALAAVTIVFWWLTVVSAGQPKCVGHEWPDGYRPRDFVALLLLDAFIIALVGALALGKSERIRTALEVYDFPVFEFASRQVTYVMLSTCSALLVALGMIGTVMGMSISHYQTIAIECST